MSPLLDRARRWARDRELTVTARHAAKELLVRSRMPNASARMHPSFFLIGAMKAGTTSLFNNLVQHPEVAEPVSKEIRYFDFHYARGEAWYLAHFPVESKARGRGERLAGEASPSYLFDPHAPHRMKQFAPEAKLLVLLRNPVDRAYSHYQHAVRYWGETRDFEQAVRSEDDWMGEEQRRRVANPDLMGVRRIQHSYLVRGRYLEQLQPWWDTFGRDRVLVLRSEDLFSSPEEVFASVLGFLGLSEWELPGGFTRMNQARYDRLDTSLRRWLGEYFAPCNAELYTALGRNMGWEDDA